MMIIIPTKLWSSALGYMYIKHIHFGNFRSTVKISTFRIFAVTVETDISFVLAICRQQAYVHFKKDDAFVLHVS